MVDRGDWQSQSVVAQKPRCLFGQFRFSLLARTTGNTAGFLPPAQPKKDTSRVSFFWWTEVDSNHRSLRRQIYSLIHLAALESVRFARCSNASCGAGDWTRTHNLLITNQLLCQLSYTGAWCLKVESNRRQRDFQSLALPTELSRHVCPQKFLSDKQIIYGDPNEARTRDLQRDRLAL